MGKRLCSEEASILEVLQNRYFELKSIEEELFDSYCELAAAVELGGKILICGNGGCAADAEHFVGELMKGFLLERKLCNTDISSFDMQSDEDYLIVSRLQKSIPAISLSSQTALMTAISNDISFDMVFAQQVYSYARNRNDVLIVLSTSGNSQNVVNAVRVSRIIGIRSISITGQDESKLSELSTCCIKIPSRETYKIQELVLPVYHAFCAMLEARFFSKKRTSNVIAYKSNLARG